MSRILEWLMIKGEWTNLMVLCLAASFLLAGHQLCAYYNPFPNNLCYRETSRGTEYFSCEHVKPILNDRKDGEIRWEIFTTTTQPPIFITTPTQNTTCPDCVCTSCETCPPCLPHLTQEQEDCINNQRPTKEAVCYQDGYYTARRTFRTCLQLNNTRYWEGPSRPNAKHPLIVNPEEYRNNTIVYKD